MITATTFDNILDHDRMSSYVLNFTMDDIVLQPKIKVAFPYKEIDNKVILETKYCPLLGDIVNSSLDIDTKAFLINKAFRIGVPYYCGLNSKLDTICHMATVDLCCKLDNVCSVINMANVYGQSPLYNAIITNDFDKASYLVDNDACLFTKNIFTSLCPYDLIYNIESNNNFKYDLLLQKVMAKLV